MKFVRYDADGKEIERRSPCGERGLKYVWSTTSRYTWGRSPCGERGLKFKCRVVVEVVE